MKTWLKYTLTGILLAAFLVGMFFLIRESRKNRNALECSEIELIFADEYRFIDENDLRGIILERFGKLETAKIDSLDLARIESVLDKQSAIRKSQVWTTDDGVLHVSISQREPVIRFMDKENGFYVDNTGYIFPLFTKYTAPATVIYGPLPQSSEWIQEALDMVDYMNADWSGKVDSIAVDGKGRIFLRLREQKETVEFGKPKQIEDKFARLSDYENRIRPLGKKYSTINLTYDNQIICK